MAVSVENARLNLRTAARNVAARLGVDPSNMAHDERRAYNSALAAEVLKYPQSFTPEIITIAERVRDQGALDDASFSWGDFTAEALTPAGDALQSIGDGALATAGMARWLIPLAVLVFVGMWIFSNTRTPPPAGAPA